VEFSTPSYNLLNALEQIGYRQNRFGKDGNSDIFGTVKKVWTVGTVVS
jgi:hypothetical protein